MCKCGFNYTVIFRKLYKLQHSFSLCNYVTYILAKYESFSFSKAIVHGFVKNGVSRCWNVRLYVLKLHTEN